MGIMSDIQVKSKKRSQKRKQQLFLIAVIVLAVAGIGAGAYFWAKSMTDEKQVEVEEKPEVLTARQQANNIKYNPQNSATPEAVQAALGKFDSAIDGAASKEDKQELLLEKALFALKQKLYDEALLTAQKAEEMLPNSTTSQVIAIIAADKDDKELAVKYYKITISRYEVGSVAYQREVGRIEAKIKELGGQL